MTQDLKTELAEMVGPAEWRWLSPHADRDALLLVDQGLDLVEVGLAIAEDDLTRVSHWLSEALVTRPSPPQLEAWSQEPRKQFQSLIVQPFVLVQPFPTP
ncbi:MAG: DUF2288 domain-containing protein [Nodosilinea sp. LVE1205-7]|jgi:hypothetical protein